MKNRIIYAIRIFAIPSKYLYHIEIIEKQKVFQIHQHNYYNLIINRNR